MLKLRAKQNHVEEKGIGKHSKGIRYLWGLVEKGKEKGSVGMTP